MKKLVLGIIAVIIAVAVVALYLFREDEAITTAETEDVYQSDRPVYDQLLQELDSTEIYNDSIIYGHCCSYSMSASVFTSFSTGSATFSTFLSARMRTSS